MHWYKGLVFTHELAVAKKLSNLFCTHFIIFCTNQRFWLVMEFNILMDNKSLPCIPKRCLLSDYANNSRLYHQIFVYVELNDLNGMDVFWQ